MSLSHGPLSGWCDDCHNSATEQRHCVADWLVLVTVSPLPKNMINSPQSGPCGRLRRLCGVPLWRRPATPCHRRATCTELLV
ncbi:hypothetical protein ElyMa_000110300 [Elysia marginata]|uniref:Uncharacterized protein n=1 Tax=Elysia marginata TaxID=1093978 RepID=A0AAV4ELU4_9GAST|nr:hypothetical protein ElyMa_000110300 [Elysia marginata]